MFRAFNLSTSLHCVSRELWHGLHIASGSVAGRLSDSVRDMQVLIYGYCSHARFVDGHTLQAKRSRSAPNFFGLIFMSFFEPAFPHAVISGRMWMMDVMVLSPECQFPVPRSYMSDFWLLIRQQSDSSESVT